jgi:arylsulfatase A-like enzyme
MKQKIKSNFLDEKSIEKCILIAFVIMISLISPAHAAADSLEVNIISPAQVMPGSVLKIRVSLINTQEISSFQVQSESIGVKINKLNNIIVEEKTPITINTINYENPFHLIEKKNVNKKLAPIGDAISLRDELRKEFETRITHEKLSAEQIESYILLEKKLNKILEDERNNFIFEIPVPEELTEGETLKIPINIDYSTGSSSTKTFSAIATVTVTSNPVPKRAIIIVIDSAKRDALYNSLAGMPNMQVIINNGVKFTDTKTVFPSITLAAQASIFTGNYPNRHNIPGNVWFEKSSLTYREYGADVWYGGIANNDLSKNVKTIYEASKNDLNMNSTVIFNQYSRLNEGTTRWIIPGPEEYFYNEITHEYHKVDSNAMSRALEDLMYLPLPGIMTIYLPGLDGYGHLYGPSGLDPYNQEYYLKNYIDGQIGRLLYGDCVKYYTNGNCEHYFYGLIGEGFFNETIIVIVSDHGQIDSGYNDTFAINKLELEIILRDSGYDIIDTPLESDYDAIAAPNGGMAHIYIRDINSKDWNDQPELSDLRSALDAFKSRTDIDIVLVKYSGSNGYRVYIGSGNTLDLETFFEGKINYPDAVNRIRGLDSTRSGDIILLAKNGWYFAEGIYKGEHGGLSQEESYIPLIFSGPTISKGVTETTPASNIDMSITLANLLGFSMPEADGIVLPVEELRFINGTVMDNTNREGIPGVKLSTNTNLFTTTNASGFYSFAVSSGKYNIMAKFEPMYYSNSSITVSTIGKAVAVQDIELVRKPTGNITGSVKHAWL